MKGRFLLVLVIMLLLVVALATPGRDRHRRRVHYLVDRHHKDHNTSRRRESTQELRRHHPDETRRNRDQEHSSRRAGHEPRRQHRRQVASHHLPQQDMARSSGGARSKRQVEGQHRQMSHDCQRPTPLQLTALLAHCEPVSDNEPDSDGDVVMTELSPRPARRAAAIQRSQQTTAPSTQSVSQQHRNEQGRRTFIERHAENIMVAVMENGYLETLNSWVQTTSYTATVDEDERRESLALLRWCRDLALVFDRHGAARTREVLEGLPARRL